MASSSNCELHDRSSLLTAVQNASLVPKLNRRVAEGNQFVTPDERLLEESLAEKAANTCALMKQSLEKIDKKSSDVSSNRKSDPDEVIISKKEFNELRTSFKSLEEIIQQIVCSHNDKSSVPYTNAPPAIPNKSDVSCCKNDKIIETKLIDLFNDLKLNFQMEIRKANEELKTCSEANFQEIKNVRVKDYAETQAWIYAGDSAKKMLNRLDKAKKRGEDEYFRQAHNAVEPKRKYVKEDIKNDVQIFRAMANKIRRERNKICHHISDLEDISEDVLGLHTDTLLRTDGGLTENERRVFKFVACAESKKSLTDNAVSSAA